MLTRITVGAAAALAVALALDAAPPWTGPYRLQEADRPAPMSSLDWSFRKPVRRVLLIGNSFTFTGDVPAQLVNIASADPGGPVRLEVSAATLSGASLADAWAEGSARRALAARLYDVVVLQEQSSWPFTPAGRAAAEAALQPWAGAVRAAGATPMLVETWSDREGAPTYGPGWSAQGLTPAGAQARIAAATADLGAALGMPVIPAGSRVRRLAETPGGPDMYAPDGHHPSAAGAWVVAASAYRAITGRPASASGWRPPGVTAEQAGVAAAVP